jgi:hypothetical protein
LEGEMVSKLLINFGDKMETNKTAKTRLFNFGGSTSKQINTTQPVLHFMMSILASTD